MLDRTLDDEADNAYQMAHAMMKAKVRYEEAKAKFDRDVEQWGKRQG